MGEYRYMGEIGIGRLRFSEPVSEERVEGGCDSWYVSNVGQEIPQTFESSACSMSSTAPPIWLRERPEKP